jgi:hypothetical protein
MASRLGNRSGALSGNREGDRDEGTSGGRRWTEAARDIATADRSADGGGAQAASGGLLREEQRADQSIEIDVETQAKSWRRIAVVWRRERRKSSWTGRQTTEQRTKARVGRREPSEESTNDETEKKMQSKLAARKLQTCETLNLGSDTMLDK